MSEFESTYRGHKIEWSDNQDKWYAPDFMYYNAARSKVKNYIDRKLAAERKLGRFDCWIIDYKGNVVLASITEYCGPSTRSYENGKVQVKAISKKNMRKSAARSKETMTDFVVISDENKAAIKVWHNAIKARKQAEQYEIEMKAAIPRLTEADIPKLVEAFKRDEVISE